MALTIVIVLSYGLFSLKDGSTYAAFIPSGDAFSTKDGYAAAAASAVDQFTASLEKILTKELIYIR